MEIAGIKIYKSMNIPFFGRFGTQLGGTAGAGDVGEPSPGNLGTFVGEDMLDDNAVSGDNYGSHNDYGADEKFANSCGLIFQREGAAVVEAIGPQVQVTSGDISVVYQGDVILGRLAMGSDYLNPAACVELVAGVAPLSGNTAGW